MFYLSARNTEAKGTTMNFPALNGETVTEAHAKICAERGHATHTVDGVQQPHCPRCGEAKNETPTGAVAMFDMLLKLERDVDTNKILAVMGTDLQTRNRGKSNWGITKARLSATLDELSSDELRAYGEYRKTHR